MTFKLFLTTRWWETLKTLVLVVLVTPPIGSFLTPVIPLGISPSIEIEWLKME